MFETLELQNLNKLVEGEIGDFPSPEAFHTVKVERFKCECIKTSTQVSGKFPMPVFALVGNFTIKPCELSNSAPPVARAFLFTTHGFIEVVEVFQGLFQKLRRLYLLTGVKCQKRRLHTKICTYALSCSGQRFNRSVICDDIEVERPDTIAQDLDVSDISVPLSVVVIQDIAFFEDELLFDFIPFFERQTDSAFVCGKFVACLKLRRPHFMLCFELWRPDAPATSPVSNPSKESFVSDMDMDNHLVKRIARDPRPMFMRAVEQFGKMRLQTIPACVFSIATVISLFQTQKVIVNIAKVVKHIAQAFVLWMLAYLKLISAHWVSQSHMFNPFSVGRKPTRHLAMTLRMSVSTVIRESYYISD